MANDPARPWPPLPAGLPQGATTRPTTPAAPAAPPQSGPKKSKARRRDEPPEPKRPKGKRAKGRPPFLPPDGPEGPPPANPDDPPLSEDERRFIEEWLVDRHQTRAYMRAFPNCFSYAYARRMGSEFAARPHVAREMRAIRHAQRLRCQVDADSVLEEYCRVGFSDVLALFDDRTGLLRLPRQIPLEVRKAISSVKISRERRTVINSGSTRTIVVDTVIEYKLWDKVAALSRLSDYLGLKTTLPPVEALLMLLPPVLAAQVRAAIAGPKAGAAPLELTVTSPQPAPKEKVNGNEPNPGTGPT